MPDGVTVKIDGLQALERNLNRLAEDVAKKHAVAAVRAGNKVLKQAVVASWKAKFTVRSGETLKNIRTKLRIIGRGVRGATVKAYTFLAVGKRAPAGRFWERGFRHIGRGKGRRAQLRRGRISGKRMRREWMRPAMEEAAPRVIEAVVSKLREVFR